MDDKLCPELGAIALAKSLLPHVETVDDLDEFLLFPPDLFAFTSLILSTTGAYRLIVSPPRAFDSESTRELWMPTEDETMMDFSEFHEGSTDDFKDILKLVEELFLSKEKISVVLRSLIDAGAVAEIVKTYESLRRVDYKANRPRFRGLETKISRALNTLIGGPHLYEVAKTKGIVHEDLSRATFADEFWDLLEQPSVKKATDEAERLKRLNRLFLEGLYSYAIEISLTWAERVRKAGLMWRKQLAHTFDVPKFETLKRREPLARLENVIDTLENFSEIIENRDRLSQIGGKINEDGIRRRNGWLAAACNVTGQSEQDLSLSSRRTAAIFKLRRELEKLSSQRRKEISAIIGDEETTPKVLQRYWHNFRSEISSLRRGQIKLLLCETTDEEKRRDYWQRFVAVVSLHAIADEACAGWGIRGPLRYLKEDLTGKPNISKLYAEDLLLKAGTLSTISSDRCRVLPKRHTAEVGITLRSVSCNLGFHRSSVNVRWGTSHTRMSLTGSDRPLTALNVLLLPIPLEIHTTDFRRKVVPVKSHQSTQDFFEYNPDVFGVRVEHGANPNFDNQLTVNFENRIKTILNRAREEVGRVDMVVLPEIAIHEGAVEYFEKALLDDKHNPVMSYIAGVREAGERFNRNAVYFKVASKSLNGKLAFGADPREYRQYKHHRWKLDRSQIIQYQLGGALSPAKNWWEAIRIGDREVNFVNLGEQITVCPLICEDLARQDPIADLIRTVGPTLVIAILMDGPQLLHRWAGKYASVLGDDPGSAVITLTSFGMVQRSQVPGLEPSRTIALWSSPDAKTEIRLEEKAEAVLLSLSVDERKEKSSDGREEMGGTPSLSLAGLRQIKLDDYDEAAKILRC